MQVEAPGGAVTHLHRGEVAPALMIKQGNRLVAWLMAVDLYVLFVLWHAHIVPASDGRPDIYRLSAEHGGECAEAPDVVGRRRKPTTRPSTTGCVRMRGSLTSAAAEVNRPSFLAEVVATVRQPAWCHSAFVVMIRSSPMASAIRGRRLAAEPQPVGVS